jgi:DNA-directed RNA polymerase specialized sigma24 family protein
MRYDSSLIPKSVPELIEYGWQDFMRLKIKRFNLKDINNDVEDILQDMYVQMIENNFLAKYDPEGRPFEVYLSVFIYNFMCKRYKKEALSKNGKNIIYSKSIYLSSPTDYNDVYDPSVVYLEHMEDISSSFDNLLLLKESLKQDLAQFKASSSVLYKGVEYKRDPQTVLDLLIEGKTVVEISEIFQTSKQFIYLLLKKIRDCDTLKDFKSYF